MNTTIIEFFSVIIMDDNVFNERQEIQNPGSSDDLNQDLFELFQRRFILFEGEPLEHQNEILDSLNEALSHENIEVYLNRLAKKEKIFYLKWFLFYIPIPVIDFQLLWRRLRMNTTAQKIFDYISKAILAAISMLRSIVIVVFLFFYISEHIRTLFLSDIVTYSDHFYQDVYTYLVRKRTYLIDRRENLMSTYFGHMSNESNIFTSEMLFDHLSNIPSLFILADCSATDGGTAYNCKLDRSSLVFKFSDVIREFFPTLSEVGGRFNALDTATVTLYLLYTVMGNLLYLNIAYYSASAIKIRLKQMKNFLVGLFQMSVHLVKCL